MFAKFEFIIALSYLRLKSAAGLIALFSFLGIALGVATLIITTSVMNGFRTELIHSIIGINGHISIHSQMNNYEDMVKQLKGYDGVNKVIPMVNNQAMINSRNGNAGVFIRGIEPDDLQNYIIFNKLISGDPQDLRNGIVIGSRLAEGLMVKVGDKVNLFSTQTATTILGEIPRIKTYSITGIFELGMFEYDSVIVYMPLSAAQMFFHYGKDSVNNIDLYINDVNQADYLSGKISRDLNISTHSWKESGGYLEALDIESQVMFIILTMIILVASFNIISSLIMLVHNKKSNIAILRTIGATRGSIMRIFIICGSIIGISGTILGLILGIAFVNNIDLIREYLEGLSGITIFNPMIYFFNKIPASLAIGDVMKVLCMSIGLSFLATIIPALTASRQDPVNILRPNL